MYTTSGGGTEEAPHAPLLKDGRMGSRGHFSDFWAEILSRFLDEPQAHAGIHIPRVVLCLYR